MFRTRYRIVVDRFAGYEVQRKWWWMPFYTQIGINTHPTLGMAKQFLEQSKRTVVYEE